MTGIETEIAAAEAGVMTLVAPGTKAGSEAGVAAMKGVMLVMIAELKTAVMPNLADMIMKRPRPLEIGMIASIERRKAHTGKGIERMQAIGMRSLQAQCEV